MTQQNKSSAELEPTSNPNMPGQQRLEVQSIEMTSRRGPLPDAAELAAYKEIDASLPERIVRMAEKQLDHRHDLERTVVKGSSSRSWAGLAAGFTIAIGFLIASVYLILNGHGVEGTVIGTVDVVALVSSFIYAEHRKSQALAGEE